LTQQHGNAGRCFSDHRHIEQFLQTFTAMFAITGLNHRIERLIVGHHPIHHRYGRQVAFEIAFNRVGTEVRCQTDDFGTG